MSPADSRHQEKWRGGEPKRHSHEHFVLSHRPLGHRPEAPGLTQKSAVERRRDGHFAKQVCPTVPIPDVQAACPDIHLMVAALRNGQGGSKAHCPCDCEDHREAGCGDRNETPCLSGPARGVHEFAVQIQSQRGRYRRKRPQFWMRVSSLRSWSCFPGVRSRNDVSAYGPTPAPPDPHPPPSAHHSSKAPAPATSRAPHATPRPSAPSPRSKT